EVVFAGVFTPALHPDRFGRAQGLRTVETDYRAGAATEHLDRRADLDVTPADVQLCISRRRGDKRAVERHIAACIDVDDGKAVAEVRPGQHVDGRRSWSSDAKVFIDSNADEAAGRLDHPLQREIASLQKEIGLKRCDEECVRCDGDVLSGEVEVAGVGTELMDSGDDAR